MGPKPKPLAFPDLTQVPAVGIGIPLEGQRCLHLEETVCVACKGQTLCLRPPQPHGQPLAALLLRNQDRLYNEERGKAPSERIHRGNAGGRFVTALYRLPLESQATAWGEKH